MEHNFVTSMKYWNSQGRPGEKNHLVFSALLGFKNTNLVPKNTKLNNTDMNELITLKQPPYAIIPHI